MHKGCAAGGDQCEAAQRDNCRVGDDGRAGCHRVNGRLVMNRDRRGVGPFLTIRVVGAIAPESLCAVGPPFAGCKAAQRSMNQANGNPP